MTVLLGFALALLARAPLAAAEAAAAAGSGVVEEAVPWLGVRVDPARMVNQHLHAGDGACVPATLINALRCGPADFQRAADALPGGSDRERLDGIIAGALSLPSVIEAGQPCYSESNGVRPDDMPQLFGRLLAGASTSPPSGRYLDRVGDEGVQAQLVRVHDLLLASITAGVPVVLSLRAFAASRADESKEFRWNGLSGHAVLLVALPRAVLPGVLGFAMRYLDPWTASVKEGYVRGEVVRGFKAVKGSGSKDFVWLENAFLEVDAPGLQLGTQRLAFHERSLIILNYGVGRFPAAPAP
jgi:hypothetical protein